MNHDNQYKGLELLSKPARFVIKLNINIFNPW